MKQRNPKSSKLRGTINNYKESVKLISDLANSLPVVNITENVEFSKGIEKIDIIFSADVHTATEIGNQIGDVKEHPNGWILTIRN